MYGFFYPLSQQARFSEYKTDKVDDGKTAFKNKDEIQQNLNKIKVGTDQGKIQHLVICKEPLLRQETQQVSFDAWGIVGDYGHINDKASIQALETRLKYRLLAANEKTVEKLLTAITLVDDSVIEAILPKTKTNKKGLSGDNILTKGVDLSRLEAGDLIKTGESGLLLFTGFPHTACKRFAARFGTEAQQLLNSPQGNLNKYRGVKLAVLVPGVVTIDSPLQIISKRQNPSVWLVEINRTLLPKNLKALKLMTNESSMLSWNQDDTARAYVNFLLQAASKALNELTRRSTLKKS